MSQSDVEELAPTARCLWCGSDRPVDVEICPSCRHAWIDATIDEATGGQLDGKAPAPQPQASRRPWWRNKWVPLSIAGLAVLVYAAIFWVLWDTTTPQSSVATSAAVAPRSTTAAPAETTTLAPVQTSPTVTTTASTTSTTTTTSTLPPVAAVEPAIATDELTLGAFALGPLRFGSSAEVAAGRLVASFGQPDARFTVGENWGMCPGEVAEALTFGHLTVILRQEPDGAVLVGYRHEEPVDGSNHETAELRTISGLALGEPLSAAYRLYSVVVEDTDADGAAIYLVLRSSDRRTLLWGELGGEDDPRILSINSPRPCDGGPFGP